MIKQTDYYGRSAFKTLRILILSAFLLLFFKSCDTNSENNLLTFYYHAENSEKEQVISNAIKDFSKETGIEVIVKEYFPNDINHILNSKKNIIDVIEINYLYLSDINLKKYFLNFDMIKAKPYLNRRFLSNNYLIPYLEEIYLLIGNNNENLKDVINLPFKNIDDLYNASVKADSSNKRAFGLVVNDGKNSFRNFLTFVNWNGGEFFIENDSISLNKESVIKTFEQYRKFAPYSFIGTKKEIENEFLNGRLNFCSSNSVLLNKIFSDKKSNYSFFQLMDNEQIYFTCNYIKSFLAINKKSQKDENSIRFINYITNDSCLYKFHNHSYSYIFTDKMKFKYSGNNFMERDMANIGQMQTLYQDQIIIEMNKAISSAVYSNDPIMDIILNSQNKINKLLKSKKHKRYR